MCSLAYFAESDVVSYKVVLVLNATLLGFELKKREYSQIVSQVWPDEHHQKPDLPRREV